MPIFELALYRPPPTLSLQAQPLEDELSPTASKQAFLELVKTLRLRASGNLHKAQTRYKRNFESHVRGKNADLKEGDEAYVKVEVTEMGRNHKLESLFQGPYKVLENAKHALRLQIGDEQVRISSDSVTKAPSREFNPVETPPASSTPSVPPALSPTDGIPRSQRRKKTVRFLLPEPEVERDYVIERIVDAQSDNAGQPLYRVRWMGYNPEEDTWEPEGNLPSHLFGGIGVIALITQGLRPPKRYLMCPLPRDQPRRTVNYLFLEATLTRHPVVQALGGVRHLFNGHMDSAKFHLQIVFSLAFPLRCLAHRLFRELSTLTSLIPFSGQTQYGRHNCLLVQNMTVSVFPHHGCLEV
jgi:hypothetical protein